MRGVVWCIWITVVGTALTLLGLAIGEDLFTLAGTGMLASVVVGWPALLLAGALSPRGPRRP